MGLSFPEVFAPIRERINSFTIRSTMHEQMSYLKRKRGKEVKKEERKEGGEVGRKEGRKGGRDHF